ncbi:spondin-1-like [Epargyreus clarus]|uniref:spondin-1-like n=1 Tax=Epargyreus clarus TaxID=520877 RepID=UPI003C2AD71C
MFLVVVACLVASARASPAPCERAPPHAQPADANYRLGIAGDPDLFLPGELYTVSLQSVDSGQGPTPFVGFTIWAEVVQEVPLNDSVEERKLSENNQSLGTFQAYDSQAKPHEVCIPAVNNATSHPKTEVQVIWNAPTAALEFCVRLCARAEHASGGGSVVLARKMCPAPVAPGSLARPPPIVEPCCACDEAKYEVTFEGHWSQNTHPRDFPPESAQAHFGDIIGASHTAQYRVWQEGRIASTGLRRLADDGATTALEKELKAESDHIRTIIKARGITWQQVASGGVPSTFAVFRVDAKHHLVSLVSKLAPSPDWVVGISALELCNANCTWRRSSTLPLYPYDAGTDSGITYTARRSPTIPPAPVRALRPEWPRDERSPFYSPTGEMRPFARLRLTRLRLYEKSCDPVGSGVEPVSEVGVEAASRAAAAVSAAGGSCAVHAWGGWGPCSVTCGAGHASRQRDYVWPARAYADACRTPLTEYRKCRGPRVNCKVISQYEPEAAESSGPCAVSPWSEWSPCEGCGVRARTRQYLAPRAHKRCHVGFRARTVLSQAQPCDAGPCFKPPGEYANATNFDWFFIDNPRGECTVTAWGGWSPCSARCGRGRRLRARLYVARDSRLQPRLTRRLLRDWNQRFAELQNIELPPENTTNEDPHIETLVQEHLDRCQFTLTQQEALCDGEEECDVAVSPATTTHLETSTKRLKSTPSSADNEVIMNDTPNSQDIGNCETGPWMGWSDCFGECDYAVKLNYRLIVNNTTGIGKSCHKLVKSRSCKPGHCRRLFVANSTDVSTTTTVDDRSQNAIFH